MSTATASVVNVSRTALTTDDDNRVQNNSVFTVQTVQTVQNGANGANDATVTTCTTTVQRQLPKKALPRGQCVPMPLPALGTQRIIQGNGTNVGTVISLQCPAKHRLMGGDLSCVMDANSTKWVGETYCKPLSTYEDFGFRMAVVSSVVSSAIILFMSMAFITCCVLDCLKEEEKKKQERDTDLWQSQGCVVEQEDGTSRYSHKGRNNNNNSAQGEDLSPRDGSRRAALEGEGEDGACRCHQHHCCGPTVPPPASTSGPGPLPGRGYDQPPPASTSGPGPLAGRGYDQPPPASTSGPGPLPGRGYDQPPPASSTSGPGPLPGRGYDQPPPASTSGPGPLPGRGYDQPPPASTSGPGPLPGRGYDQPPPASTSGPGPLPGRGYDQPPPASTSGPGPLPGRGYDQPPPPASTSGPGPLPGRGYDQPPPPASTSGPGPLPGRGYDQPLSFQTSDLYQNTGPLHDPRSLQDPSSPVPSQYPLGPSWNQNCQQNPGLVQNHQTVGPSYGPAWQQGAEERSEVSRPVLYDSNRTNVQSSKECSIRIISM